MSCIPLCLEMTMRFTETSSASKGLEDQFYCRARRKDLELDKCLNDYVHANAFEQKRSACFRCPQGRLNRDAFSGMEDG